MENKNKMANETAEVLGEMVEENQAMGFYDDGLKNPLIRSAPKGLTELAFQLFWAWTNHPDEAFARKAWDTMLHGSTDPAWPRPADPHSIASWERVARRGIAHLGKGIPDDPA